MWNTLLGYNEGSLLLGFASQYVIATRYAVTKVYYSLLHSFTGRAINPSAAKATSATCNLAT